MTQGEDAELTERGHPAGLPGVLRAPAVAATDPSPDEGRRARRTRELRRSGTSRRALERAVADGTWVRVRSGLVVTAPEASPDDVLAAARCVYGEDVVVTGPAAAALWGVRDVPDCDLLHIRVGHSVQRIPPAGVAPIRTRRPRRQLWREEWPVVPVADAVIDAGVGRDLRTCRALVTGALGDRRMTRTDLAESAAAAPRRAGAAVRQAAREALLGSESAPECEAADLLVTRGLELHRNCRLLTPDGRFLGRPDLHVVGTGVLQEVDSQRHHGAPDDLDATLDRHSSLAASGFEVLHATTSRLRRTPAVVLQRLGAALALRRAAGLVDPPGWCVLVDGRRVCRP